MDKKLVLYAVLSAMLISGCAQAEERSTDGETGGDPIPKETSISGPEEEITIGESENISEADQMEKESLMDQAILNNTHNIYRGYIGDTEIRMKISRQDDLLTAAFITRADEEWDFEGEIVNDAEFELQNPNGDFMNGAVKEQDGFIILSGNGEISGQEIVFSMTEETYMPIGEDFDNYYSGGIGGYPEEIEAFARKIKGSVNNKEEFIKLFQYPITIYINGEPVTIQGEEEMGIQYDWLITEDAFRETIENMFTKYLFKNYLGVCVEYGIIWFSGNRITALNFHSAD